MVTSYWDMAASFCVHGALDAELLLESANELIMVWAKLEKFVHEIRTTSGLMDYLKNIEQVIEMVDWAPARVRWLQERMAYFQTRTRQSQNN
jgi:predicted ABC-class ATPase